MRNIEVKRERVQYAVLVRTARIEEWKKPYSGYPRVQILLRRMPELSEFRFESRNGLWYAELNGIVHYYAWQGPGNNGGFGGTDFPIRTKDGRKVTLKGPWSSRAGVMNTAGFGPCVDAELTDSEEDFKRGYTFIAGAVTLTVAEQACAETGKWTMQKRLTRVDDSDIVYAPVKRVSGQSGGP